VGAGRSRPGPELLALGGPWLTGVCLCVCAFSKCLQLLCQDITGVEAFRLFPVIAPTLFAIVANEMVSGVGRVDRD
jgi:hypothetical protein